MVIVIIPFTGDVSKAISEEVQNVFSAMRGSESTKVLLCINKCGPFLDRLKEELIEQESPIEFLKTRFIQKLNEYYENSGQGIYIKQDEILFTDWDIGDSKEAKELGLAGVEVVKCKIRDYLINYSVYREEEQAELKKCLAMPATKQSIDY